MHIKKGFKYQRNMVTLLCGLAVASCAVNDGHQTHTWDPVEDDPNYVLKAQASEQPLKQIHGALSLQRAAEEILKYHPRVAQAKGNENSEQERINIAKAGYYPQISGGLGTQYNNNRSRNDRYGKDYIQNLNLEVNQVLYDFGKTSSAVKSAEYGYLGAKAYTNMTNEELVHAASLAVISTERYQKMINLAKEQVARVKDLGGLVEQRYEKGASNLSDVYQARSRLDDVQSEELDTVSQYQSTLRTLGIITGQREITGAQVGALPATLSLACSTAPDWKKVPAYAVAELEAEQALADLERARANELPTIALRGNASHPLNAKPRYGSRTDATVGLNVTVPVYQGGSLSASKRAAQGQAESAAARKANVQLEIGQKMTEAQVHLENLKQRANLLSRRVENLKNTKELYKQQYLELGTRSLLDLLNSEQEYHQARMEVVNNQLDIVQTQVDCAFYQGKLIDLLKIEP
ncbi:TolC family protein [Wohlfahrtiimonas chitiniclastica]|uniref:TolC family protein n=1 Tax=Wohlfahrtiimonas chitiniclastica TaxID=400946 RepID=UPI001BCEE4FC|nr:TolC family protein [Wohlfahrtiimonas chitiniclastica]MBS7826781.1 TolC family protein [Wohlfahrtiimonas chitiniclastica]